jgi:hypothetical protein
MRLGIIAFLLVSSQPARADDQAIPPEIEKLLALPEDKIDIGTAALVFSHDIYAHETDIPKYSAKIDKLVAEVRDIQAAARARLIPGITDGPDDTIFALNEVFYRREGFKYDHSPDALTNAPNFFLPGERKLGICSTLPSIVSCASPIHAPQSGISK